MEGIKLVNDRLIACGITSVQDASHRNDRDRWHFFENVLGNKLIKSRITMMMGLKGYEEHCRDPFISVINQNRLKTGGVKIIIDESSGRLHPDQQTLNRLVLSIHQAGCQAIIHAVEETAITAACNAIENALKTDPRNNHRHRIEHCSICPSPLARRVAELDIVVVTNPSFLYFSGDRYLETVPAEQQSYLYPLSTLIQNGVLSATGSDAPIAGVNPLIGIHSAVNRISDNNRVVNGHERIKVLDAIRMATSQAAYSAFEEDRKGTITPGKLADLVLLDVNPMQVKAEEIKDISVEMTIIGGEII